MRTFVVFLLNLAKTLFCVPRSEISCAGYSYARLLLVDVFFIFYPLTRISLALPLDETLFSCVGPFSDDPGPSPLGFSPWGSALR